MGKADLQQQQQKYDMAKCQLYNEKNSFAFWIVIILLFSLALGNLCLTLTIAGVLKIYKGMENIELIQGAETVKFFGNIDFDRVLKVDGKLEGFHEEPVEISGDNGPVSISLVNRNAHPHNKIHLSKNGSILKGINHFEVKDGASGRQIFSTSRPTYNLPQGASMLHTNLINAARITSPINDTLKFQTRNRFTLKGTEGTRLEAKEILWSADQNIFLKSDNGSAVLLGANGIYVNVNSLPIVKSEHGLRAGTPTQFKLCVCFPQGRIFRIAVPKAHATAARVSCAHFSNWNDPCA
ncbi:beta-sarcoglycan [Culex quinquefasciatus]|uniref:Beta-sarcoglycan n=1 Tax=Culex quinquefasciatus TaxID=7176 RepID=B0WJV7_CULQU|nr:beta-sarcoglycan [Culex quinquefasciatus]EDS29487.1 beta-sarcoglycan [Culex quinquefasciatus]|eukprot:XP_001848991.1 beta-sarcoglycan [Culex quinquefasciatus]